jgi:hypothetical protein
VQISNTVCTAAAQNEIQLASNGITLDTMADQSGNYDLFVPLQAVAFDYARANFEIVDPFSPATIGPDVIDLSQLTTATSFQLPTITGVCIDDDAGVPDFDDPDCDEFGMSTCQRRVKTTAFSPAKMSAVAAASGWPRTSCTHRGLASAALLY